MKAVLIVLVLAMLMSGVANAAWYEDWDYRTPLEIDGNTEDLTDYQVNVTLQGYNSSAANYVDFDKVLTSGADIRFTDDDKATEIDFWIEEWVDTPESESATVWVEVPSVPTVGTKTIYVYYGKAGTTTESSWMGVFSNASSTGIWQWTNMEKYSGNPVLNATHGSWDEEWLSRSSVIEVDSTYWMYYEGSQNGNYNTGIGLAFSSDLINWTKYENNPIESSLWGGFVRDVRVYKIGDEYWMYYTDSDTHIDLATSADGINFTNHPENPILVQSQMWEDKIMQESVLRLNSTTWYMWYATYATKPREIGIATSTDGINWTKYENNPVFKLGASGEWDDYSAFQPRVFFKDDVFHMLYTGSADSSTNYRSGYAWSEDGYNWTKYRDPVIGWGGTDWVGDNNNRIAGPIPWQTGLNTFSIFYGGWDGTSYRGIGLVPNATLNFNNTIEDVWFDDFEDGSTNNTRYDLWYTPLNYASDDRSRTGDYSIKPASSTKFQSNSLGTLDLGSYIITQWIYFDATVGRRTTINVYDNGTDIETSAGCTCRFKDENIECYNGTAYIDTALDFQVGWNKVEIIQKASMLDMRINNSTWATDIANRNTINNIDKLGLGSAADVASDELYFDDFSVRKYTSTEPTSFTTSAFGGYNKIFTGITNTISATDYVSYSAEPNVSDLVDMTVLPTSTLTINVTTCTEPLKRYNESASSDAYALYTVGEGNADTTYVVNIFADVNGSKMQTFRIKSNSTGFITYNTTGYGYDRWTEIKPATEPAGTIVIISVCGAVLFGGGAWVIRRWTKKN